jgi:hypothetical protein
LPEHSRSIICIFVSGRPPEVSLHGKSHTALVFANSPMAVFLSRDARARLYLSRAMCRQCNFWDRFRKDGRVQAAAAARSQDPSRCSFSFACCICIRKLVVTLIRQNFAIFNISIFLRWKILNFSQKTIATPFDNNHMIFIIIALFLYIIITLLSKMILLCENIFLNGDATRRCSMLMLTQRLSPYANATRGYFCISGQTLLARNTDPSADSITIV